MVADIQPRWIPACEALNTVCRHYMSHTGKAETWCREESKKMLLRRLKFGQLPARAMTVDQAVDYEDESKDERFSRKLSAAMEVPTVFWELYDDVQDKEYWFDWVSGDFYCEYVLEGSDDGKEDVVVKNIVMGLEVDARYLFSGSNAETMPSKSTTLFEVSARAKGGRAPANWWPSFAEELAWYVHEAGFPAGKGNEGQSEIIDAVFERMTSAGKPEPSRTTVQPVINALLARVRSAGK
jgi:hypothetical protein